MFDRDRAASLNADHHRRMAAASQRSPRRPSRDHDSRTAIIGAMLGCAHRHAMRVLGEGPLQVLELGAGYAGDRDVLRRSFAAEYTGIELVESVAASSPDVHHMAIEEMPEAWNGRFHFVYSRHVMEHVLSVPTALAAIRRVLAPNGIVGAVTPHYFPDPEPAHVTQLRIGEWMVQYSLAGLEPVYAVQQEHECPEAHIVCVLNSWPLRE
jgi:SAM-dependent methyltransferase